MSHPPFFRILIGFVFLVFMLFFLVLGGAAGCFVNAFADVIYESKAVIQIAPNWIVADKVEQETIDKLEQISTRPHEQNFVSAQFIQSCLEKNNLFVLDSFVGLSEQQCVDLVRTNLTVEKTPETNNIFKLSIRLQDPQDVATILNNLIKHYHDSMTVEFPDMSQRHFVFRNLQVARIGDQVSPILAFNLPIGVGSGFLFGLVVWLLLNPFRINPRQFSIRQLSLVFIAVSVCFAIGAVVVRSYQTTLYASTAKLKITDDSDEKVASGSDAERRIAEAARMSHSVLLRHYYSIERTLERHNLFVLDSFVDLSKEEVVNYVRDNLRIEAPPESPEVLELQLSLIIPEDSKVVLEAITQTYSEVLKRRDSGLLYNYTEAKDPSSEVFMWVKNPVVGIPIQHEIEVLQPASEVVESTKHRKIEIPEILAGALAAMVFLLVFLTWFFARGKRDNAAVISRPLAS